MNHEPGFKIYEGDNFLMISEMRLAYPEAKDSVMGNLYSAG